MVLQLVRDTATGLYEYRDPREKSTPTITSQEFEAYTGGAKTTLAGTTDDPFLPDRGKGMIYHQKPQHRLPGEQSLKESNLEVQLLPDLYKGKAGKEKALKVMEDARRKSVKRAGDANRKRRLEGLKKGGRAGKGKTKTQGINRSKRTGFSGRGAGVALRGF